MVFLSILAVNPVFRGQRYGPLDLQVKSARSFSPASCCSGEMACCFSRPSVGDCNPWRRGFLPPAVSRPFPRALLPFRPPFFPPFRKGGSAESIGPIGHTYRRLFPMPALPGYIPAKDADLNNWFLNFSTLITASPSTYGLLSSDATSIAAAVASWSSAYALVTSSSTKTAATVSAKNTAKVTSLMICRPYAQTVSLNAGVSSANKTALGVNPRTSTPSPITPPESNPILNVQSASNLSLIVRYRDSAASPSVKAKPYGVTSCRISGIVSSTPVSDPTVLLLIAQATKSPLTITRGSADGGKQLYLAGQWVTRTGGVSPWSPIINFTVPAGM
jgi:hypothetical protein